MYVNTMDVHGKHHAATFFKSTIQMQMLTAVSDWLGLSGERSERTDTLLLWVKDEAEASAASQADSAEQSWSSCGDALGLCLTPELPRTVA